MAGENAELHHLDSAPKALVISIASGARVSAADLKTDRQESAIFLMIATDDFPSGESRPHLI